jgi:hypothetical protein
MCAKYIRDAKWVKNAGFHLWVPTPSDVREQTRGGFWFTGDELGSEYRFRHRTDCKTALARLRRRFGQPNNTFSARVRRRIVLEHKRYKWEYVMLVDDEHWYSIYELDGKIFIGYRFLVESDVDFLRRKDFYAGDGLNKRFCAFIGSVIDAKKLIPASSRWVSALDW